MHLSLHFIDMKIHITLENLLRLDLLLKEKIKIIHIFIGNCEF